MFHEYETKILDINITEIEKKLEELWATLIKPEILMRRRVFDVQAHSGNTGKQFRLRQQGNKTTLTYKERWWLEVGSTKELETEIADFDIMAELLQKLEWQTMVYQENKRKVYSRNDIEFCIDTRPMIPTYLEIEAPRKEQVEKAIKILGLEGKDVGDMWMIELYEKHNINLHDHKVLKFGI